LINCADFMAEIGNYLEGDVAAEIRAQIESHLAHCQTCQIVYDSARKTVRVLTDCGSFDLPEAASKPIVENVMARIRAQGRNL
jgi:predicted anti-sigma-YlaC factor YlaD